MKKRNTYIDRHRDDGLEKMDQAPLEKFNFILMIISAAVIVLGFLLMLGSGTGEQSFNADIFSTRRIVIGPTIAFLGFIFMGVSIIIRRKPKEQAHKSEGGHD